MKPLNLVLAGALAVPTLLASRSGAVENGSCLDIETHYIPAAVCIDADNTNEPNVDAEEHVVVESWSNEPLLLE